MIILNKANLSSTQRQHHPQQSNLSIAIIDLHQHDSTNSYYAAVWKKKYNVSIHNKEPVFKSNLVRYLKGQNSFIE